ncbi:hypothetical protein HU764_008400 [Pseudomonas sp. SWRI100]|uniref:hypothetical protein n=1 Tax=Pseudomonas TaxID=286 RepID=UPI001646804F|nr:MULTISPECIES: hypothetical protein [Pseudomonas]MBC3496821.1 hypothetical protein [Pseudomonas sp. SWRI67]MBV4526117.1 hypothetical protein [Pseudomonas kermanshahensis]
MALTQQQRNDNAERKRIKFDEKALRHRVRPGIHQAMGRICERSKGMQINEVLQMAILKMDAMPDDELNKFLMVRHEILLSEDVVQAFYDLSVRSILSNPDRDEEDEIERPAA